MSPFSRSSRNTLPVHFPCRPWVSLTYTNASTYRWTALRCECRHGPTNAQIVVSMNPRRPRAQTTVAPKYHQPRQLERYDSKASSVSFAAAAPTEAGNNASAALSSGTTEQRRALRMTREPHTQDFSPEHPTFISSHRPRIDGVTSSALPCVDLLPPLAVNCLSSRQAYRSATGDRSHANTEIDLLTLARYDK